MAIAPVLLNQVRHMLSEETSFGRSRIHRQLLFRRPFRAAMFLGGSFVQEFCWVDLLVWSRGMSVQQSKSTFGTTCKVSVRASGF